MKKISLMALLLVTLLAICRPQQTSAQIEMASEDPIIETERTLLAIKYTDMSKDQMKGLYSWEENRFCSSFVALYAKNLGIPVNWLQYENGRYENPFPWSNTVKQVQWARENYPDHVHDSTLENFLEGNLWEIIKPGDAVYLTSPMGHNGYNTYYHNAILVGYRESGSPAFAEIAFGIEASTRRTMEELTSFYKVTGTDPYYTGKNTPEQLKITWIDVFSIVNETKESREYKSESTKPHLIYK